MYASRYCCTPTVSRLWQWLNKKVIIPTCLVEYYHKRCLPDSKYGLLTCPLRSTLHTYAGADNSHLHGRVHGWAATAWRWDSHGGSDTRWGSGYHCRVPWHHGRGLVRGGAHRLPLKAWWLHGSIGHGSGLHSKQAMSNLVLSYMQAVHGMKYACTLSLGMPTRVMCQAQHGQAE